MQSMIHFPLYDLDLGPYLTFGANSQPDPAVYDLFGIVVSTHLLFLFLSNLIEPLWLHEWRPLHRAHKKRQVLRMVTV